MKIANRTQITLVWLIIALLSGCSEPTLSERLSGVWVSVEMIGDTRRNPGNFEMQLEIDKSGNVNVIAIDKTPEKTKVDRGSGKLEGEFIVFGEDEIGKVTIEGDLIKIVDIKRNKSIVFKRAKL